MFRIRKCFLLLIIAIAVVLTSCGGPENSSSVGYDSSNQYDGSLTIRGSKLASHLIEAMVSDYTTNVQPKVEIDFEANGCKNGVEDFIAEKTDILVVAYPTTREEDERIAEVYGNGQSYAYRVATDAVVLIKNKENTWADEMTKSQIIDLLTTGGYTADDKVKWSDIDAEWPKEEIKIYGPSDIEGLNIHVQSFILQNKGFNKNLSFLDDYSEIVNQVSADENSIAFIGFSSALREKDKVDTLMIDFGRGPIEPTYENIRGTGLIQGPYSEFAFPVWLMISGNNAKENVQILDFIKYLMSEQGVQKIAQENGYIPLIKEEYDTAMKSISKTFRLK